MRKFMLTFLMCIFNIAMGECQVYTGIRIVRDESEIVSYSTYSGPKEYIHAEFEELTNADECQLVIYSDGTIYWERYVVNWKYYGDELCGRYFLVRTSKNRYKMYIRWDNGKEEEASISYTSDGRVIFSYKNSKYISD